MEQNGIKANENNFNQIKKDGLIFHNGEFPKDFQPLWS
jgi:hypothetical protein